MSRLKSSDFKVEQDFPKKTIRLLKKPDSSEICNDSEESRNSVDPLNFVKLEESVSSNSENSSVYFENSTGFSSEGKKQLKKSSTLVKSTEGRTQNKETGEILLVKKEETRSSTKENSIKTSLPNQTSSSSRVDMYVIDPSSLPVKTFEDQEDMETLEEKCKRLQLLVERMQLENQHQSSQLETLKKECKRCSLLAWKNSEEKLNQEVELELWKKKYSVLQQEQEQANQILSRKDWEIEQLKSALMAKNEANYKMALKLLDYKTKVNTVQLQLRKYSVKKIYKFYANADVEITLLKNPANGVLSIDVAERGKHLDRAVKSIQRINGMENRFIIYYTDGAYDTFESVICHDIVDSINEFLQQQ